MQNSRLNTVAYVNLCVQQQVLLQKKKKADKVGAAEDAAKIINCLSQTERGMEKIRLGT
jgi:hypothetical protein